jgi:hypothetical protein
MRGAAREPGVIYDARRGPRPARDHDAVDEARPAPKARSGKLSRGASSAACATAGRRPTPTPPGPARPARASRCGGSLADPDALSRRSSVFGPPLVRGGAASYGETPRGFDVRPQAATRPGRGPCTALRSDRRGPMGAGPGGRCVVSGARRTRGRGAGRRERGARGGFRARAGPGRFCRRLARGPSGGACLGLG